MNERRGAWVFGAWRTPEELDVARQRLLALRAARRERSLLLVSGKAKP